jgi:hypothetical protein
MGKQIAIEKICFPLQHDLGIAMVCRSWTQSAVSYPQCNGAPLKTPKTETIDDAGTLSRGMDQACCQLMVSQHSVTDFYIPSLMGE